MNYKSQIYATDFNALQFGAEEAYFNAEMRAKEDGYKIFTRKPLKKSIGKDLKEGLYPIGRAEIIAEI